jgi:hypothetical protein
LITKITICFDPDLIPHTEIPYNIEFAQFINIVFNITLQSGTSIYEKYQRNFVIFKVYIIIYINFKIQI